MRISRCASLMPFASSEPPDITPEDSRNPVSLNILQGAGKMDYEVVIVFVETPFCRTA